MAGATERQHPLYRGETVIGRLVVTDSAKIIVDAAGEFIPGPDFESCKAAFEAARRAAERVDSASDAEYEQRWYEWRVTCKAIEALELSFGEHHAPVEAFGIDSAGIVEIAIPFWWMATVDECGNAEQGGQLDGPP